MTHEGAGLIKTEVVTAFERGGVENALALAEKLAAEGYGVNVKEVVHPMTLKSFIRDELSKGVAVPFDVFSITPFSFATVKLPKSEK
jgi:predicted phosphoribosyltransferase